MENQSGQFADSASLFTELMLTSQYLLYAKNVWQGLDEAQTISLQWLLPRKNISYTEMLDSLLGGKDILTNPPVYRQLLSAKRISSKIPSGRSSRIPRAGIDPALSFSTVTAHRS
jgi:hypothetical protein